MRFVGLDDYLRELHQLIQRCPIDVKILEFIQLDLRDYLLHEVINAYLLDSLIELV